MSTNGYPLTYRRVLSIAGSDSGGGAGIQADLKTFAANGCYGMSVVAALTAQNTLGVSAIHQVPADFVKAQMDAVLGDIGADAVKVGMLFSVEIIETVAEGLIHHGAKNIVLDPVMVAQSGHKLVQDEAIAAIKELLIPLARVITPNLPEAGEILGRPIGSSQGMIQAARELAELGCAAVLVKGGHLEAKASTDYLYLARQGVLREYTAPVIATKNNHGTGCTLSSAIAAQLAHGLDLEDAVKAAKDYITQAIKRGADYTLGGGCGPVHHFHAHWA